MTLPPRALATVLAALRYWQQDLIANEAPPISHHFTEHTPLDEDEIDSLCECLNSDTSPDLRTALQYLLEQTVEMDIAHGIPLTEGEQDARQQALAALGITRDQSAAPPEETTRRETIYDLALSQHASDEIDVYTDFRIIESTQDNGCHISAWLWIDFSGTPLDKEAETDPADSPDPSADCTACNDGSCAWCREEQRQRTNH